MLWRSTFPISYIFYILNGRVTPQYNNFTFVTPRGASVPDYMICPLDNLRNCEECKVFLMKYIVNLFGLLPPQNLPDHSFLFTKFGTYQFANKTSSNFPRVQPPTNCPKIPKKKNLKKVDEIHLHNGKHTCLVKSSKYTKRKPSIYYHFCNNRAKSSTC